MALPAVLALCADPLLSVVDTLFVGRAGPAPLAALGVNSALFTFSFVVFNFLATATTPLVAASLAAGDRDKAGRVTLQAMALALVLGVALAGGLVAGAEPALALMGAPPSTGEMHDLAKEFLLIRCAGREGDLCLRGGGGSGGGSGTVRCYHSSAAMIHSWEVVDGGLGALLGPGRRWLRRQRRPLLHTKDSNAPSPCAPPPNLNNSTTGRWRRPRCW